MSDTGRQEMLPRRTCSHAMLPALLCWEDGSPLQPTTQTTLICHLKVVFCIKSVTRVHAQIAPAFMFYQ